jgi:hypothetical protein
VEYEKEFQEDANMMSAEGWVLRRRQAPQRIEKRREE